jgi:hypothetical protein
MFISNIPSVANATVRASSPEKSRAFRSENTNSIIHSSKLSPPLRTDKLNASNLTIKG